LELRQFNNPSNSPARPGEGRDPDHKARWSAIGPCETLRRSAFRQPIRHPGQALAERADPGLSSEDLDTRLNIEDLHASRHLPNLTAALLRRGFSERDVRLILGENYLRVFREVMGVRRRLR